MSVLCSFEAARANSYQSVRFDVASRLGGGVTRIDASVVADQVEFTEDNNSASATFITQPKR